MNATVIEAPERPVNVEEQTRVVMELLREYSGKLVKIIENLLRITNNKSIADAILIEAAWLLDQYELMRKPLLAIVNRGSALRESVPLEPMMRDELALRLSEIEVHLHHAARGALELRNVISHSKWDNQVAKFRFSAGLPAGA